MKIGGYLCTGCGIGDRLDTKSLETVAVREGRIGFCKTHDFLCSQAGVDMIKADMAAEGDEKVTKAVIMACSRRAKTESFHFGATPVARVNLREGVIWIRPEGSEHDETTQEMAADYIRMGCAEAKAMQQADASGEQSKNNHIMVVGGGMTGMTAALEASKAGYYASIIEKADHLGGVMGQLKQRQPERSPYQNPQDTGVAALIAAVEADDKITVYLNSSIAKTAGAPGRFEVDIASTVGTGTHAEFGAIVQATGFTPYDANKLPEFSYGKTPNVVTQLELEALALAAGDGPIKRADGKIVENVVFVQCAGQRSQKEGHLSYCSGHCCATSIKQAMYFKDTNPDIETTVLFDDIRTPGVGGENFYRSAQDKFVTFRKGKVSTVDVKGNDLQVNFKDLILDEDVHMDADLVVLATGMLPNSGTDIDTMKDKDASGEIKVPVTSILNLNYRQGPDVPHLVNGFADSHFICFPYETRRTGIYTAGPVRRPMDAGQAQTDAMGAVMKAIQAIENSAIGRAAHPRSGDLSFPTFRKEGCTQCKRCTVECPFGAIDEDEKGYPKYNEARCRRCGTCMGACPVQVISFKNYSIETVGAQLKAVDVPDEFQEKPRILVLACENDAYPALDMAAMKRNESSAFIRVIPVRCLGSTNTIWIKDALGSGYDGVVMMGCKKGADYQCHFVKGSEMAHVRMEKIGDTLSTMNLESERVAVHEVAITDIDRAPKLLDEMVEVINRVGLSPFKF
ncbi:hydrogenase iron-sulfur subunit [Thiothrix lacustris]|uniref:Hydrogenase iron-sulfur subunit n=1 Tax=Thiothrix lacustris TaxID=525917 RepID=A0ABY9MU54_9GAMM|nr:hydrogenase iron-sulfur subunit [Thiothrix lacustris]WML92199.1 hydrogenase iron-sulfur subunit [Thiothrix lacustris]